MAQPTQFDFVGVAGSVGTVSGTDGTMASTVTHEIPLYGFPMSQRLTLQLIQLQAL